ncbi:MAG TPA: T9SS type A sorting domain-containing protein [Prolixibacteraceae bacterium]|nr:T9SS type A sorting domain-containing protein [Prolixibacteraceae bacterium]
MRLKLFLILLLAASGFFGKAQEAYMNLIFSEIRMDRADHSYVELCNMGNKTVNLSEFELGHISPWEEAFFAGEEGFMRLPDHNLAPGESYVIANVSDWVKEMENVDDERWGPITKNDFWHLADLQIHRQEQGYENGDPTDSVSIGSRWVLECWNGDYAFYLRHHFAPGDSMVIDHVNGVFTEDDDNDGYGSRPDLFGASDVAGFTDATRLSTMVRKHSVTTGTGEDQDAWDRVRGIDITDSEWIPIPFQVTGGYEPGARVFWTVGNHQNTQLNAQTLKSNTIEIDWQNLVMNVQWGARNNDSIMNEFERLPGIAWHYHLSHNPIDSAFSSVRTGDSLTLYACGDQLVERKFALNLLPPVASECRVIPKNARGGGGGWYTPFVVTEHASGIDSILEVAAHTRVDTLLKYLEKPENATWQIVWVDGIERPDLSRGDVLKVRSADGTKTKDYFIYAEDYRPSHNADLSSITWPDVPDDAQYKAYWGWKGDTIPGFASSKPNYKVQIPADYPSVPAFVAKTADPDARVQTKRATSFGGTLEDRTIRYTVTAEDDSVQKVYSIELEKEKDWSNVQPYTPEPFFSEFVFRAGWAQSFIEICNPGNQELDLSEYLIAQTKDAAVTPAEVIEGFTNKAAGNRYEFYVPGRVWQDTTSWQIDPGYLEVDYSVDPIVQPGDVFVLGFALPWDKDATSHMWTDHGWNHEDEVDVNFRTGYNPWGIDFGDVPSDLGVYNNVAGGWPPNCSWILYKITNDSVLSGTKPLTDYNDVKVIDIMGRCAASGNLGVISSDGINYDQNFGMVRLPQIHKGDTIPGGSFYNASNPEEFPGEWFASNETYWTNQGYTDWLAKRFMIFHDVGAHNLNTITEFISTISSNSYVVSPGYSMNETVVGPEPGTTVADFLNNISKADPNQELTFKRGASVLTDASLLETGDLLTVVSADKQNTTQYAITVAFGMLADNAEITSSVYTVSINGNQGTISGFDAGILLGTVYNGLVFPSTASLITLYNADGSYAPFQQINFDTTYVQTIATDRIFIEVIAQNGTTKITYQLQPNASASDAYVLSNVYDIDQVAALIKLLPDGTNVPSFFGNLIPAPGATLMLKNKLGQERQAGTIYKDDQLVVTAQDGVTQKVYSLKLLSQTQKERRAFAYSQALSYTVNQTSRSIRVIGVGITVAQFSDSIFVSEGASFVVLNADRTPKTGNEIVTGDIVVVTSQDGTVTRTYSIFLSSAAYTVSKGNIRLYPNPTTGELTLQGVESGNTIHIFNAAGKRVVIMNAHSEFEKASLHNQPSGLFMVVIHDGTKVIERFKVIKR